MDAAAAALRISAHKSDKTSPWDDDLVERLKLLWADGVSASAIALEFGRGITRNAIIGKVHRLGFTNRVERRANSMPRPARPQKFKPLRREFSDWKPFIAPRSAISISRSANASPSWSLPPAIAAGASATWALPASSSVVPRKRRACRTATRTARAPTTARGASFVPAISSSSTPACKSCARMPHDLPQRRGRRPHLGRVRQGSAGLAFVSRTVSEIEITSHR